MVDIHISNKSLYLIVSVFFLFLVMGMAVAYNSGGPPSVMGHSLEELELLLPTCASGEFLTSDGISFICLPVTGTGNVVGGGYLAVFLGVPSCSSWGVAVCTSTTVITCPLGTTIRQTSDGPNVEYYQCIVD